jgi:hypothetical protein
MQAQYDNITCYIFHRNHGFPVLFEKLKGSQVSSCSNIDALRVGPVEFRMLGGGEPILDGLLSRFPS